MRKASGSRDRIKSFGFRMSTWQEWRRFHLMVNLDLPDRRESNDSLEYIFTLSKEPKEEGDEGQHNRRLYYLFQTKVGAGSKQIRARKCAKLGP